MERQLNLEILPVEIINHIASYLNIEDIISCCATSPSMRELFNDDLIWKRHCDKDTIDYLKRTACVVDPNFEWYEDGTSNLSPVTKWKSNYMMQAHLFRNWRNGMYTKCEFEFGSKDVVYSGSLVKFYESDYLFLHTLLVSDNKMLDEIWDVTETPFLHSTFRLNLNKLNSDSMNMLDFYKIVKHKLIVAHHNIVLIYDISLSSFTRIPLIHAFVFDRSEKSSKDVITHDESMFYRNTFFETASKVEIVVCGAYFLGAVTSAEALNIPTLHVWNFETGKKVEEVIVPSKNQCNVGLEILTSQNEKDVIVKLRVNNARHSYHCYGYDLSKMRFSSFTVKINYCDFIIFQGKFVIGVASDKLYIYDYLTSRKLLMKSCQYHVLKKSVTFIENLVLFGTFDNIVHVLDLSTLNMIHEVKLGFTLYSLHAICNKFVVVNSINSEVWEIGRTVKKLFRFPMDGSFAAVNQSCTKLAIEKDNKIIIFNFW